MISPKNLFKIPKCPFIKWILIHDIFDMMFNCCDIAGCNIYLEETQISHAHCQSDTDDKTHLDKQFILIIQPLFVFSIFSKQDYLIVVKGVWKVDKGLPKDDLQGKHNTINQKEDKVFVIVQSNAVPCPRTMMIHSDNASTTIFTVMSSWNFDLFAFKTKANFL